MKARFLICLILLLGIETMVAKAEDYPIADNLEMPLKVAWEVEQGVGHWYEKFRGYHLGEDVLTTKEEPVYAIGNGIVRFSGFVSGYGHMILIEHNLRGAGKITAVYAHMGKRSLIANGQIVYKGQTIGYLSANPQENGGYPFIHLHFGIRPGEYTTKTVYIHFYNGDTGQWGWKWSWLYMGYSRSGNFTETQKEDYDFDDQYILDQWQKDLKGFIESFQQKVPAIASDYIQKYYNTNGGEPALGQPISSIQTRNFSGQDSTWYAYQQYSGGSATNNESCYIVYHYIGRNAGKDDEPLAPSACLIKLGFARKWEEELNMCPARPLAFPLGDEKEVKPGITQQVFFNGWLTWNEEGNHSVRVHYFQGRFNPKPVNN